MLFIAKVICGSIHDLLLMNRGSDRIATHQTIYSPNLYIIIIFSGSDEQEFTQLKTKDTSSTASIEPQDDSGTTKSLILLVVIFLTAVALLSLVYLNFPKLTE